MLSVTDRSRGRSGDLPVSVPNEVRLLAEVKLTGCTVSSNVFYLQRVKGSERFVDISTGKDDIYHKGCFFSPVGYPIEDGESVGHTSLPSLLTGGFFEGLVTRCSCVSCSSF